MKQNNIETIQSGSGLDSNNCLGQYITNGTVNCEILNNGNNANSNQSAEARQSQISSDSGPLVLDVRNLEDGSTSGYQSSSYCGSACGISNLEGITDSNSIRCPINAVLASQQLNVESDSSLLTISIPREDIPRFEAEHGIELQRYIRNIENLDPNFVNVGINETNTPEERITWLAIVKKYYSNISKRLLFNVGSHILATGILTSAKFWNEWGLIPRLLNPIFTILNDFINHCISDKDAEKRLGKKTLEVLKKVHKILNFITIGGTVVETAIFNFGNLPAAEQKEFFDKFWIILNEKIFWNDISRYFTVEQTIALLHNIFSAIDVFNKFDNKLMKLPTMFLNLTRAALVIAGFNMLTYCVANGYINTDTLLQKYCVLGGAQLACFGAYLWSVSTFKDICISTKELLNKCFTSETHL